MAGEDLSPDESVMEIAVNVVPRAPAFDSKLKAQVLPGAERVGRDIAQAVSNPIGKKLAAAIAEGVTRGGQAAKPGAARQGDQIGRTLGDIAKARVEAALKAISDVHIGLDSSRAERQAARLKAELETLRDKNIGVDIDVDEALARVNLLRNQFSQLARDVAREKAVAGAHAIPINIDAVKAQAELTGLSREIRAFQAEAEKPIKVSVDEAAATAVRDKAHRLQADFGTLKARIDLNLDSVDESIVQVGLLREQFLALAREIERARADNRPINVNVNVVGAMAELEVLKRELKSTRDDAERHIRVHADDDTGSARAGLRDLATAASQAGGHISTLLLVGAALAPVIVPAAAAAAAAVGAIGASAIIGIAALGALGLGFSGIAGAVGALNTAQTSGAAGGGGYASSQNAVADALDRVKDSQQALKNTILDAADARITAQERERTAERNLADEQKQVLTAQLALNDAREQARRDLIDLADAVAKGSLAERQAAIDLAKAQVTLTRTNENPSSSGIERDQAQVDFDAAKAKLVELQHQNAALRADQAKAAAAGVEGSKRVQDAQASLLAQLQRVADAEENLSDARRAYAAEERHSAASIASAQKAVVQAQQAVKTAAQGAGGAGGAAMDALKAKMDALSPAGRRFALFLFSLKPTLLSLRNTAQAGLLPGVEAGIRTLLPAVPALTRFVGQLATTMGTLFAAGARALQAPFWRQFFGYIGQVASPALITFAHIIGNLITGFAGLILGFAPVSAQLGGGLEGLTARFAAWSKGLSSDQGFQKFVAYVRTNGPQVVHFFGSLIGSVVRLGVALAPIAGVSLRVFTALAQAISSLPTPVLTGLVVVLYAAAAGLKVFSFGFRIFADATKAGSAAAFLFSRGLKLLKVAFLGGPWGWVVLAIVAVVVALVELYKHNEAFRRGVVAAWGAVKAAAEVVWNRVLWPIFVAIGSFITGTVIPAFKAFLEKGVKPGFGAASSVITKAWKAIQPIFSLIGFVLRKVVGPAVLWLWVTVVKPAWAGITATIGVAWAIIQPILLAIGFVLLNVVAPVVFWFWRNVIGVAFTAIGVYISVAVALVKVVLGALILFVRFILAPIFTWLWKNVVAPVFLGIFGTVKTIWDKVRPILSAIGDFIATYVAPAFAKGVNAIKTAWEKVKEIAAIPVRFVVNTIINNGILKAWNWIATKFGADTVDPIVLGFAGGGAVYGMGNGTSDSNPALLSRGEHVWTSQEVRALGGHTAMFALRRAVRGGALGRRFGGPVGYADGGPVGASKPDGGGGFFYWVLHPIEALKRLVNNLLGGLASNPFARMLTHFPFKIIDFIAHKLGFDSGGYLPPGVSVAYNGTGRPEPVLTGGQWQTMMDNRRSQQVTHRTTNIYPRYTTLDIEQLRAYDRQQSVLERVGRRN